MTQTTQFIISVHEPKTNYFVKQLEYYLFNKLKYQTLNATQFDFSTYTKTNAKIKIKTVSNPEENSLFLDLKPYAFLLKDVAPALSVPLVTNLRRKEGVDNEAVPTR